MSVSRQSLLAAAAALQAVAASEAMAVQAEAAPSHDRHDVSMAPSTAMSSQMAVADAPEQAGCAVLTKDEGESQATQRQLPPPPPADPRAMEDLSRRVSTILRHRPRGCGFRTDGSANLEDLAAEVGVLPVVLWDLAQNNPGPHRLPRWECAQIDGEFRLRSAYKHTFHGFDRDLLRAPMASGAPFLATEGTRGNKRWRNFKSHERKRARRSRSNETTDRRHQ